MESPSRQRDLQGGPGPRRGSPGKADDVDGGKVVSQRRKQAGGRWIELMSEESPCKGVHLINIPCKISQARQNGSTQRRQMLTSALSCRMACVDHMRILLSWPQVTSLFPEASTSIEKSACTLLPAAAVGPCMMVGLAQSSQIVPNLDLTAMIDPWDLIDDHCFVDCSSVQICPR